MCLTFVKDVIDFCRKVVQPNFYPLKIVIVITILIFSIIELRIYMTGFGIRLQMCALAQHLSNTFNKFSIFGKIKYLTKG